MQLSKPKHRNTLTIAAAAFLLCAIFAAPARAMEPPTNAQFEKFKQDGSLPKRIQFAKHKGNDVMAEDLRHRMRYKIAKISGKDAVAMAPPSSRQKMPTTGAVKILVLCIQFNDYPHVSSIDDIRSRMFGDGDARDFPYESVSNFYKRSSYGQLNITGDVLGWTETYMNRSSVYSGDDETIQDTAREDIIRHALDYWNMLGWDFTQYDNNNDGVIDELVVIWTGPDTGWGSFWWAYKVNWWVTSSYTIDGKSLGIYVWQPESLYEQGDTPGPFDPNTTIHETGHALGLPDYYDYDTSVGPAGGLGGLDIMDNARGDHNAFSKFVLDWLMPKTYTYGSATGVTLRASDAYPDAALIMPEARAGSSFGEFYIAQNRNLTGNDSGQQPGRGLLVWHVDSTLDSTGGDFKFDNSVTDHKLIRLMEADGLEEIETTNLPGGGYADSGDYYKSGKTFTPSSRPNSHRYDGTDTGISLTNISAPGDTMTLDISVDGFGVSDVHSGYPDLTLVDVIYNRDVDTSTTAADVSNYTLDQGKGHPLSAVVQPDKRTVRLTFTALTEFTRYTLTITGVLSNGGAVLYTGNGPFYIDTSPRPLCRIKTRCIVISSCADYDLKTGCEPLQKVDSSAGYPPGHTGFSKAPFAGAGVYLLRQDGSVLGAGTITGADGNYRLVIDTVDNPIMATDKFSLAMKIPAAEKSTVPCSNEYLPIAFTGGDCGVIVKTDIIPLQDSSTMKLSLPLIPVPGAGRSPIGNPNCDTFVDSDDFLILRQNFGKTVGDGPGDAKKYADFNGDGVVDSDDFLILRQNYSKTLDAPPGIVPDLCNQ